MVDPDLEPHSCAPESRRCHPDRRRQLAGGDRAEAPAPAGGNGLASTRRALRPSLLSRPRNHRHRSRSDSPATGLLFGSAVF
ncbi:hypothetical protein Cadr_000028729 [Camelus dromedarius]|uniref:Uncharacterized protein n=1 Tax=Camelus dromedarius TaxID=9838 RepID=A0A5N4C854_CAMDR|nr:hypothetical protein Cadr_000028729 [Camelus dromedarius]